MTTLTRTKALTGIWRVVEDIIRDFTEQRSVVFDEGERRSEAREGPMGGDFLELEDQMMEIWFGF